MLVFVFPSLLFHPLKLWTGTRDDIPLSAPALPRNWCYAAVALLAHPHQAELCGQACAVGAFLAVLPSLHGFWRLHHKHWPGQPGRRASPAAMAQHGTAMLTACSSEQKAFSQCRQTMHMWMSPAGAEVDSDSEQTAEMRSSL